jgi:hypothetical protein
MLLAYGVIFFTLIYAYFMVVYYFFLTDKHSLMILLDKGFKHAVRFHYMIVPIIIALLWLIIFPAIPYLLLKNYLMLFIPLTYLVLLYFSQWIKKYLHELFIRIDKELEKV